MPTTSEAGLNSIAATGESALNFAAIDKCADELGINKLALAKMAGVDRTMIWRYRQGMRPPLEVARRLAEGLNISMDVITGRGNPTPAPPPGPSSPPPPPGPKAA